MANYREIVTKAVIAKGKKTFVTNDSVSVENNPSTVLGCWVINHVLVDSDNIQDTNTLFINYLIF